MWGTFSIKKSPLRGSGGKGLSLFYKEIRATPLGFHVGHVFYKDITATRLRGKGLSLFYKEITATRLKRK
jgi:hypothetical protein